MIYTSLAVLALSASTALANPLTNLVHMHPHAQADSRVSFILRNNAPLFRDVKIDGHLYTVAAHSMLNVKAPTGTVVYADSRANSRHRGDEIVEVTSTLQDHEVRVD